MSKNDIERRLVYVSQHLTIPWNVPTESHYKAHRERAIQYMKELEEIFEQAGLELNWHNTDPVL